MRVFVVAGSDEDFAAQSQRYTNVGVRVFDARQPEMVERLDLIYDTDALVVTPAARDLLPPGDIERVVVRWQQLAAYRDLARAA